jgi:hypothetical protein
MPYTLNTDGLKTRGSGTKKLLSNINRVFSMLGCRFENTARKRGKRYDLNFSKKY